MSIENSIKKLLPFTGFEVVKWPVFWQNLSLFKDRMRSRAIDSH
jgi:hypothetical protein